MIFRFDFQFHFTECRHFQTATFPFSLCVNRKDNPATYQGNSRVDSTCVTHLNTPNHYRPPMNRGSCLFFRECILLVMLLIRLIQLVPISRRSNVPTSRNSTEFLPWLRQANHFKFPMNTDIGRFLQRHMNSNIGHDYF